MRTLSLILLLLTSAPFLSIAHPVKDPISGIEYIDEGAFHKDVTTIEKSIEWATYFIIAAQTDLSVNTGASAVINAYNDMRAISAEIPIYFVLYNNGGIPKKDIDWYIKDVYRIPMDKDSNFHLIRNDSLYKYLQFGGPLTKMYYVYNGMLVYKNNAKHHFMVDEKLPLHKFTIKKASSVSLKPGKLHLSYLDFFMPVSSDKILYLTDIQNTLITFDAHSGEVVDKYTPDKSGIDHYCELIAKTPGECDTARKYVEITDGLNRKNYYIFNFTADDKYVYISAGLQVFIKLPEDKVVINDENEKDVYKKGDLYGYGYSTLGVLDKNLKPIKHYYLPENIGPDKDITPAIDFGFTTKDHNKIIAPAGSFTDNYSESFKPLLMQLKITDTGCVFDKYLAPEMTDHYKKSVMANVFDHYCRFNNTILFMSDVEPLIYDINRPEPVSTITGDGREPVKESIPEYTEESDEVIMNFMTAAMGADSELLYIVYKYRDRYFLEIKNTEYTTLDIINISGIDGFSNLPKEEQGESMKIYKNKIFVTHLKNDEYYLTIYDINNAS